MIMFVLTLNFHTTFVVMFSSQIHLGEFVNNQCKLLRKQLA